MNKHTVSNSVSKISIESATREDYDIVIRLFGTRSSNGVRLNFGTDNRQLKMFMSGNMAKFHKWSAEKEIAVLRAVERVCSEELR